MPFELIVVEKVYVSKLPRGKPNAGGRQEDSPDKIRMILLYRERE
jgi:hypothetical protein